jgi:50S ribosomal protein L16 3-hydroxylase
MIGNKAYTHFSFDTLFADLEPGVFLREYFPSRAVASHSDGALRELDHTRISRATSCEILRDFESHPIKLWIDSTSFEVNYLEASAGFNRDGAIYIANAERVYSDLVPFRDQLCKELGIPSTSGSCSIFMSRRGTTVPMHFDHDFGFNILIRGRKRWTMARNEYVSWPTVGYDASKEPPPLLKSYLDKALPTSMPNDSFDFEVGPGAVCFVPRGYFHSTFAEDDCIALDFAIEPPLWADYLASLIRNQLILQPQGRQSVFGISSSSQFHDDFHERFGTVVFSINEVRKIVGRWQDQGSAPTLDRPFGVRS